VLLVDEGIVGEGWSRRSLFATTCGKTGLNCICGGVTLFNQPIQISGHRLQTSEKAVNFGLQRLSERQYRGFLRIAPQQPVTTGLRMLLPAGGQSVESKASASVGTQNAHLRA
jgi:hypothetical protein